MKIKAAPGLKVRDPHTHYLIPDDGLEIQDNGADPPVPLLPSWQFYLLHGDIVSEAAAPAEQS